MTIIERKRVLDAYARAVKRGSDHDEACAVVAQALGISVDLVQIVVAENESEVQS